MAKKNKDITRKKAFLLSSVMKNPKLAEALFDSWGAPIGSTKRTKAKNILSSLHRAYNIKDGQGGAEGSWWEKPQNIGSGDAGNWFMAGSNVNDSFVSPYSQNTQSSTFEQTSPQIEGLGTRFVKSADKFLKSSKDTLQSGDPYKEGIYKTAERAYAGTPYALSESAKAIYPWATKIPDLMSTYIGQPALKGIGSIGMGITGYSPQQIQQTLWAEKEKKKDTTKTGTTKIPTTSATEGLMVEYDEKNGTYKWKNRDGTVHSGKIGDNYVDNTKPSQNIPVPRTQEGSNMVYKDALKRGLSKEQAFYEARYETGIDPDKEAVEKDLSTDPTYTGNVSMEDIVNSGKSNEQILAETDPSLQEYVKELLHGADLLREYKEFGYGPKSSAIMIMKDAKSLAQFLNIPIEEAKKFPVGLLSEQLGGLYNTLKKENKINEQLDNLLNLMKRDVNIDQNFKDYIRGKDEYLGAIDKMIDQTETKIANMDTSNPYVAQRMQGYMTYLTTLQGRQGKRYIDFLEMGINQHKAELTSAENTYKASLEQVKSEFEIKGAATAEEYNNMKTSIEEMYNNVMTESESADKAYEYEYNKTMEGLKLSEMEFKVLEAANKASGYNMDPISAATYGMYKDFYTAGTDKDTGKTSFKIYNAEEVRDQAARTGNQPGPAVASFLNDMGYTVNKEVSGGDLNQFRKFKEQLFNLRAGIEEHMSPENKKAFEEEKKSYDASTPAGAAALKALEVAQAQRYNDYVDQNNALFNNLRSGIIAYVGSDDTKIKILVQALNELTENKALLSGGAQDWAASIVGYDVRGIKMKRDEFVSKYQKDFGALAGPMYDSVKSAYEITKKGDEERGIDPIPDLDAADMFNFGTDIPVENAPATIAEMLSSWLMVNG